MTKELGITRFMESHPSNNTIPSSYQPKPTIPLNKTGATMSIIDKILGRDVRTEEVTDESRPVKLVPEGRNVWRVVYAD